MNPRKLSPAVLAALGLSACVDGCDPSDLPLVGSLFGDGQDDDTVGPCLNVMCLSQPIPQPVDTGVQACLKVVEPEPVTQPIRVGPCLRMAPPRPPNPTAPVPVPVPDPAPAPAPPVPEPPVGPCLDFAPPEMPRVPADSPQDGAVVPVRVEVLAALVDAGVLAPDVAKQARRRG
ncbi:MAG: hypothetical protein R3F61_34225 [Myxococcota bacterium]